jgi:TnpA family transposase
MPVQFLTPEQIAQYGRYAQAPSPTQLAKYFHLDDTDLEAISPWREDHTRLGFALQVCTVRFLGNFIRDLTETPCNAVAYLARQLEIEDPEGWQKYVGSKTQTRHRQLIRESYGYEDFHSSPKTFALIRRLYARAWLADERPLVLFDFATAWIVQHKVLLPGATVLARLIARIINRANQRLWGALASLPDPLQKEQLQSLLMTVKGERFSALERLRRQERRASSRTILSAMRRLDAVRALGVAHIDLSIWPARRIQALARYGMMAWAQTLTNLEEKRQVATLLAVAKELEAVIQDEALDLFVMIVNDKFRQAKKDGLEARMRIVATFDQAALRLRQACLLVLDESLPDHALRQNIFQQVPREQLAYAVTLVGRESADHAPHFYNHLDAQYRSLRLFFPKFLETLAFDGTSAGRETLEAWDFLRRLDHETPPPSVQEAPRRVFNTPAWRAVMFDQDRQIDRRYYTFCATQRLVDALQRRAVFITPSRKWQDQRLQLIHGEAWYKMRSQVCAALGKSRNGAKEVEKFSQQLDRAYRRVAKRIVKNKAVSINKEADHERIHMRRQQKLRQTARLKGLQQAVYSLLPRIDLPELLLEIHALTGFADEFTHISEAQARAADLSRSVCAVLLAEACNIGIDAVAQPDVPALRRGRLRWVQQNFLRDETLTRANAHLVAAQSDVALAQQWGGGDVASADGQRFRVPVEAINAAANWKYFGEGKGITYFTFMSDQFTSFYGVIIPGAVREALYILDGLLEQQTTLEPVEVMSDTAGYTDMVFGLFWLLGYQFSPRLRDIGKTRFWRIDKHARYGALHRIACHPIHAERVVENWDDMLRAAGSLKLGHLSASALMRSLQAGKRISALAKAIIEVGRIAKTMYLLNYIDDASYRRRILIQLNRGERRHRLARAVFHGRSGELRQKYREGQEDQLGALGLVVNIIVLWNTLYMNKAIEHLRATGIEVRDEDIERLTPLGYEYIRLIGRYDFTLRTKPERGGLRPLRQPEEDG